MRAIGWAFLGGGLALLAALLTPLAGLAGSLPADSYVLGDSLGEGVAEVSHLKGLARVSVHIRGPRALEQLAQTPPDATVFLVLGTNDANGSIARLEGSIDAIVAAVARKNITLIWLGPPCVRQSWDGRARDLDLMLRARFAGTPVRYVSMRDAELCTGNLQEPDGVHLKPKGYVHMWEKAVAAAGFTIAPAERRIAAVPLPPPRPALPAELRAAGYALAAATVPPARAHVPLPIPRAPLGADITGSIARVR